MGRLVFDGLHFAAWLLIILFLLRQGKAMLSEEGTIYKSLTYLIH